MTSKILSPKTTNYKNLVVLESIHSSHHQLHSNVCFSVPTKILIVSNKLQLFIFSEFHFGPLNCFSIISFTLCSFGTQSA